MPGSSSNTFYEVSFKGPVSTINTFIRCQSPQGINGCIYLPDPTLWRGVAISNAGQGNVTLTVRGTDDTGSSRSATAPPSTCRSRSLPSRGRSTTGPPAARPRSCGGTSAAATTTATSYLTPTNTDGTTCIGCHALAPDGSKLVASAGGQNDGRLLLWDIVNNQALQPFPLAQKSQVESWNADGTHFVGVYGDATKKGPSNLMIFDGTMGTVVPTIDLGGLRADHPDWSKVPLARTPSPSPRSTRSPTRPINGRRRVASTSFRTTAAPGARRRCWSPRAGEEPLLPSPSRPTETWWSTTSRPAPMGRRRPGRRPTSRATPTPTPRPRSCSPRSTATRRFHSPTRTCRASPTMGRPR